MRSVPHSEEQPVPKPPNLTFSDDNSDSGEDQEEDSVDCHPTFGASCSSFEPDLLTQEDLNDFVSDFTLSKNQADLFGSSLTCWNLFYQNPEMFVCMFVS
jgi:hypothetical protein